MNPVEFNPKVSGIAAQTPNPPSSSRQPEQANEQSFAEILDSLDPGGWSGKFAAQSLKKGRRQRGSRSSLAGSHLPGGPIE